MTELNAKAHLTEDAIEMYALGRLPDRDLAAFEEHLLICPSCQDRLDEQDGFVHTMRDALAEVARDPQPERQPLWGGLSWQKPAMAFAVAAALLLVVVVPRYSGPGAPQSIELSAARSNDSRVQAQAGQPLELRLALGAENAAADTRVSIVTPAGREVWSGTAAVADGKRTVTVKDGLESGQYWVRIYSGSELLNEYVIAIK
jgi:anti-sigma factor RsiW